MRTDTLFKKQTVFSYEIFPPKISTPVETLYDTLEQLKGQQPDYISVTLGAAGTDGNHRTIDIASKIQEEHQLPSVAQLPAIYFSKKEIHTVLDRLKEKQVENILALRGDRVPKKAVKDDFFYASDLVTFIQEQGTFNIIGACYPETHNEALHSVEDIKHLKYKVDCGINQLITQLFFENTVFYSFKEKCDIADIRVPIQAGIMPVVNKKQIERIVKMANVTLPKKFLKMMERYEHNPEAMRDAGIAYAINQIVDLVAQGVDGIHLYTMNNCYVAQKIREAT